jgi:hypothetical protein
VVVGAAAGAICAAAAAVLRAVAGAAPSQAEQLERFYLFVWLAAVAAGVAAAALGLLRGARGRALALLGGAVACVVTIAGWLTLNTALGGSLYWDFVRRVSEPALALAFLAMVVIAPAWLLAGSLPVRAWRTSRAWSVVAALTVAVAGAAVVTRSTLYPSSEATAASVTPATPAPAHTAERVEARLYVATAAPRMAQAYDVVTRRVAAIDHDRTLTPAARATRVDRDVIPLLRQALAIALSYHAQSTRVGGVQRLYADSLGMDLRAYEAFATAYRRHDPTLFARAQALHLAATQRFAAWLRAVAALEAR